ncbi:universal stress protein [Pectinatus cerevisiiphilus]|uniref:Nucleotide-binding universal stress UspA family protein n=1 Tax=Pectinatus cerevisiiphilus TaxID=86956 RepID=A0A4R3KAJ6_9FIRM|nr:universal stress protein [Pectinatus cerevisiiphilus]TCS80126.1 nucleotide-binding universal stress UspA family protein [Pectinatus cerevisiiphilus]
MTDIKTILVPVDGSKGSDKAVDFAISLAQVYKAKVNFLYIANINQLAINACLSDAILDAVTKAGDSVLDKALEKVPHGMQAEAFSETGSPAVTILEFVQENKNDMIVMGSRGLGVVKGVLLGSVSQYVVENAKCPVVIAK